MRETALEGLNLKSYAVLQLQNFTGMNIYFGTHWCSGLMLVWLLPFNQNIEEIVVIILQYEPKQDLLLHPFHPHKQILGIDTTFVSFEQSPFQLKCGCPSL